MSNHRRNSNFQILYFLIGSCHTADGAYALLCDLKEERTLAINNYKVSQLKEKKKEIVARKLLLSENEIDILEGQAELLEIENNKEFNTILHQTAKDELKFILECVEKLNNFRKFKHLSDSEAHEAAQHKEWELELIRRAENHLLTTGSIPPDQFGTMRMHPEFERSLLPRILKLQGLLANKDSESLLKEISKDSVIKLMLMEKN